MIAPKFAGSCGTFLKRGPIFTFVVKPSTVWTLARAKESRPDVVILDLAMPRMNGLDVARALRSTHSNLPIILFTLYGDTVTTAEVEAAGINAVFSKYDVSGLVKHVEGIPFPN
jgi:DNA-binding NarL/FixJ family response regulator